MRCDIGKLSQIHIGALERLVCLLEDIFDDLSLLDVRTCAKPAYYSPFSIFYGYGARQK